MVASSHLTAILRRDGFTVDGLRRSKELPPGIETYGLQCISSQAVVTNSIIQNWIKPIAAVYVGGSALISNNIVRGNLSGFDLGSSGGVPPTMSPILVNNTIVANQHLLRYQMLGRNPPSLKQYRGRQFQGDHQRRRQSYSSEQLRVWEHEQQLLRTQP